MPILPPRMGLKIMQGDNPTFYRDFAFNKTLDHGTGPSITFTRTGTATFFDASGTLTTATANTPRFDHNPSTFESRGLLIEEARTNSIRNSQAGGAVVGVIGSGGALPTNWGSAIPTGSTLEIIQTGTSSGFSFIDLKFSGTNSSGSSQNFTVSFESSTSINATSGQTWSGSCYVSLINGLVNNINSFNIDIAERTSAGVFIVNSFSLFTPSLLLQRVSHSRTLTDSTTARVNHRINLVISTGNTFDLTLRIAAPQLEQGAFATSYIPTTNAAVSRGADSAIVTPISSFYNGTEGAIFNEFSIPSLDGSTTLRGVAQFMEAAATQNRLQTGVRGTGVYNFSAVAANVPELTIETSAGAVTAGAIIKAAQAYKSGDSARSFNGGVTGASSTSALTTPTRERFRLGDNGTAILNGHIRKVAYWPKRLPNARLQAISA